MAGKNLEAAFVVRKRPHLKFGWVNGATKFWNGLDIGCLIRVQGSLHNFAKLFKLRLVNGKRGIHVARLKQASKKFLLIP